MTLELAQREGYSSDPARMMPSSMHKVRAWDGRALTIICQNRDPRIHSGV